jgi:membrane protein DedA with SNARE-associated domain
MEKGTDRSPVDLSWRDILEGRNVLDFLLHGMILYGPLVLGLAMLPGAVGLPIPVGVLLIAAGAFVREELLDWRAVLLFAGLGALVSDMISYGLGRWAGPWAKRRLGRRSVAVWRRAEEQFGSHGGRAVFLTSWLIRGLAIPTNVIAGSSRYPFRHFVVWDATGKVIWIALHAGLGYAFASQWHLVGKTVSAVGGWLGLGAAVGLALYLVLRHRRVNGGRTARH